MSILPKPALPVLISSLHAFASPSETKVRIAGRLLSYENTTQLILLLDDSNNACLIDVSLLLDDLITSVQSLRESKSTVMVVGYAEISKEMPIPTLPAFMDPPNIDSTLVVRAILLVPAPDLDLALWRKGIQLRESVDQAKVECIH